MHAICDCDRPTVPLSSAPVQGKADGPWSRFSNLLNSSTRSRPAGQRRAFRIWLVVRRFRNDRVHVAGGQPHSV